MNIIICDDIPSEAEALENLIVNAGFTVHVKRFTNPDDTLNYICGGAKADICFFDILMPEMTGVQLAAELRAEGFAGEIIFCSTTNEFAEESYDVGAFSYILKPPNAARVNKVLSRVEALMNSMDSIGIPVVNKSVSRFIKYHEIKYIEVIKHKVYFNLTTGDCVETYTSFTELAPTLLADERFARVHQSYIVNMNSIAFVQSKDICLRCGKIIPISKSYTLFRKQYYNWMFGGEM